MKQEKLISEAGFSLHQKIILIGFSLPPLLFLVALCFIDLNWRGYIFFLVILILFLMFISLAFSKKGLIKKGDKLYKGKFFFGTTIFRRKVNLHNRPVVSILKFKKSQKLSFFSAAKPDLGEQFNSYEIFVLTENHVKRDSVMYFKNEENAQKAIQFLTNDFPLRYEVFSPDFRG
jgi:hypothetical protein